MITADNITTHEFIGLDTSVLKSTNPSVVGLSGKIVDETKSMFLINTKSGLKSIAKSTCDWKFDVCGDGGGGGGGGKDAITAVTINGSKIIKRPYDRIGMKG